MCGFQGVAAIVSTSCDTAIGASGYDPLCGELNRSRLENRKRPVSFRRDVAPPAWAFACSVSAAPAAQLRSSWIYLALSQLKA